MKTLLILLTLAVFAISVPLAVMAQDKPAAPAPGEKKPSVNCCIKGKCTQVGTEADCTKGGGKVVKDCKECK